MHGVSLKCLLLSASPFQTVDVGYVPNDRMQGVFMSSPQARAHTAQCTPSVFGSGLGIRSFALHFP